jgi:hypothetical protein
MGRSHRSGHTYDAEAEPPAPKHCATRKKKNPSIVPEEHGENVIVKDENANTLTFGSIKSMHTYRFPSLGPSRVWMPRAYSPPGLPNVVLSPAAYAALTGY